MPENKIRKSFWNTSRSLFVDLYKQDRSIVPKQNLLVSISDSDFNLNYYSVEKKKLKRPQMKWNSTISTTNFWGGNLQLNQSVHLSFKSSKLGFSRIYWWSWTFELLSLWLHKYIFSKTNISRRLNYNNWLINLNWASTL